ncbi:MAG TPA: putative Fe-S cluster assembly protein SufT [Terriglobales bacterium]|nr:putative Fe-S cluster assembly protein SufT [Terriglobales bacterium]
MHELIELKRECGAIEIPSGIARVLPPGSRVRISQFLGTGYTVISDMGCMFRIEAKDADALGLTPPVAKEEAAGAAFNEQMVWDQLKTVFDPEIPVNIVDLGLIYSCEIAPHELGGKKIDIKMSMTAPGCGMGNVLKADVEGKLSRLPEVKQVNVQVVFDPPWNPGLMSEAAKLQLGFDLDYGSSFAGMSK